MLLALCLFAPLAVSCGSSEGRVVYAQFADVGDLVLRANVQSSDAVIGTVGEIELVPIANRLGWVARLRLDLDKDASVPEGTKAIVRATSLLGEKFVDLEVPKIPNLAQLPQGAVITDTRRAADLEEVLTQLGGLLASGGLSDLGTFITAQAQILDGRSDEIQRIIDRTADVVSAIHGQRAALSGALVDLTSASKTLADGKDVTDKFLVTSVVSLRVLANQREQLAELFTQLDRFSGVGADILRKHYSEIDTSVKAIIAILPVVRAELPTIERAVAKLPAFAELFARAIPGDYIQLDVSMTTPGLVPAPAVSLPPTLTDLFREAMRAR